MKFSRKVGWALVGVASLIAVLLIYFSTRKEKPVLRVYNWSYYIGPTTIADFEKAYDVKVVYDNYASNEELLAKLESGAGGYDVIFPTDYMVSIMRKKGLLLALDHSKIPNLSNISERFLNLDFDPGNKYSIPYFYGTTGIGYDSVKVKENVDSWDILLNERYKGRITVLDDMRFTIGGILKYLGYSANSIDPAELRRAQEVLIRQKPLLKAYSSDTYIPMLARGEIWIAYGYSAGVLQAAKDNRNLHFVIPSAGTILWMDNMAIPKSSKSPELAHKFINYILDPEVSAKISNEVYTACPNIRSHRFVKKEILNNESVYPREDILARSEFLKDLGEKIDLYEKVWLEVKKK